MEAESEKALQSTYLHLINELLPQTFSYPVKHNHCFGRIILDWTFGDCWTHHLTKNSPAYKQLSAQQLQAATDRMQLWLQHPQLLVQDNYQSLLFRKRKKHSP